MFQTHMTFINGKNGYSYVFFSNNVKRSVKQSDLTLQEFT